MTKRKEEYMVRLGKETKVPLLLKGANANRLHTCNMVLCNIDTIQQHHCFFLFNNSLRALATEYFGTGVSLLVNLSVERGVIANGTDSYTQ